MSRKFGRNIVIDIIASLAEKGIFQSELKAKLAFPELYQVSAARSLQHDASEQEAARSEAKAFENALQLDSNVHNGEKVERADTKLRRISFAPGKDLLLTRLQMRTILKMIPKRRLWMHFHCIHTIPNL